MKHVVHRADSRGHFDYGWLNTHHTFSFASYHNPDRMNFGTLRVLNDDVVASAMGFDLHPHDNMEIISIPLTGTLKHRDSMGHEQLIRENEVQVMTAGTGISHSEFNGSEDKEVNFLQIWIQPLKLNVDTRYEQRCFDPTKARNALRVLVGHRDGGLEINQNVQISRVSLDAGGKIKYKLTLPENGVYVFVLYGLVDIAGAQLNTRDGIGLWEVNEFEITSKQAGRILFIEVPMT